MTLRFFIDASLGSPHTLFRHLTKELCGTINATWWWGPLAAKERQILLRQMEEALQRAIHEQVLNDPEVGPNDHFLININSNRLRHSHHSSRMHVRDWLGNTVQAQEIMQQISLHVELQRTVSIGRFLLLTHFSHSRSRPRGRQSENLKRNHGSRTITGSEKECGENQERR